MAKRQYKITDTPTMSELIRQLNTTFDAISRDFDTLTPAPADASVPPPKLSQRAAYRRQQSQTDFTAIADAPTAAALTQLSAHVADLELALEKSGVFKLPAGT